MATRNLSLTPRNEDTREKQSIEPVIQFELIQIKEHFEDSMQSIEQQFAIAEKMKEEGCLSDCKNIWRSQIVFLEGVLDFYLYELSKYAMNRMFSGEWSKSEKYKNFQISMEKLEECIKNPESVTWFVEYVNQKFSREVFLSYESMKDQLNLMGLSAEEIFSSAFPKQFDSNYRSGKQIVRELFHRRSQIAHQLDRRHTNAEQNDISKEYVERCMVEIRTLVNTIHNAAENKE